MIDLFSVYEERELPSGRHMATDGIQFWALVHSVKAAFGVSEVTLF
jgi:hypothetical protein